MTDNILYEESQVRDLTKLMAIRKIVQSNCAFEIVEEEQECGYILHLYTAWDEVICVIGQDVYDVYDITYGKFYDIQKH